MKNALYIIALIAISACIAFCSAVGLSTTEIELIIVCGIAVISLTCLALYLMRDYIEFVMSHAVDVD